MTQSERLSFDDRRCVECEIERQACCLDVLLSQWAKDDPS